MELWGAGPFPCYLTPSTPKLWAVVVVVVVVAVAVAVAVHLALAVLCCWCCWVVVVVVAVVAAVAECGGGGASSSPSSSLEHVSAPITLPGRKPSESQILRIGNKISKSPSASSMTLNPEPAQNRAPSLNWVNKIETAN